MLPKKFLYTIISKIRNLNFFFSLNKFRRPTRRQNSVLSSLLLHIVPTVILYNMYTLLMHKTCALCKLATCSCVLRKELHLEKYVIEIAQVTNFSLSQKYYYNFLVQNLPYNSYIITCKFVTGFYGFTYFSRCCLCTSQCVQAFVSTVLLLNCLLLVLHKLVKKHY